MSELLNSIWPNGVKKDAEGYSVYYPLGTNKVDISTIDWPEGDKLISPFVYQNDKLVGFVDTKALTVSGSATTTINYSHIEADFASISEGTLTVNAPNAIVKKFSWSVVDGDNNVIVTLKYKGCKTVDDVKAVDPDYLTNDIVDGVWSEGLGDLEDGTFLFGHSAVATEDNLVSFKSDLSNLINGFEMFSGNVNLVTFESDLPSLENGTNMFYKCELDLKSVERIAESLPLAKEGNNSSIDLGGGFTDMISPYARPEVGGTPVVKDEFKSAISKIIAKGWRVYSNLIEASLID